MERTRLFLDMDGTLAVFKSVNRLETLYEEGYFLNLKPISSVVEAVKLIIKSYPDIDVYVLSAVFTDSEYALEEKNLWLDQYLPEIKKENRVFVPCGSNKKDYVPEGIRETDYLLDDYTKNLSEWQPPAKGIKLLNGINHTRGTWQHDRIRYDKSPEEILRNVVEVISGQKNIRDNRPLIKDVPLYQQRDPVLDSYYDHEPGD